MTGSDPQALDPPARKLASITTSVKTKGQVIPIRSWKSTCEGRTLWESLAGTEQISWTNVDHGPVSELIREDATIDLAQPNPGTWSLAWNSQIIHIDESNLAGLCAKLIAPRYQRHEGGAAPEERRRLRWIDILPGPTSSRFHNEQIALVAHNQNVQMVVHQTPSGIIHIPPLLWVQSSHSKERSSYPDYIEVEYILEAICVPIEIDRITLWLHTGVPAKTPWTDALMDVISDWHMLVHATAAADLLAKPASGSSILSAHAGDTLMIAAAVRATDASNQDF